MNLKELEPPALYKLVGYLGAVSDFIRTGELKWYFDVRLVEYDEVVSDIALLVKVAYPESFPEQAQIKECSIADLVDAFWRELDIGLESSYPSSKIRRSVTERQVEMWDYLNECVPLEGSRIYEYVTSAVRDEFGSGGITGNFAAVVLNESHRRCVFLSGGDCD